MDALVPRGGIRTADKPGACRQYPWQIYQKLLSTPSFLFRFETNGPFFRHWPGL